MTTEAVEARGLGGAPEFAHLRAHVYPLSKRDEATAPTREQVAPVSEHSDG
jgi:hypothetical protein